MEEVYVINGASGDVRVLSTRASKTSVPELRHPKTIFIFDAKAGKDGREPASCTAFLILTSSHNEENYKQTIRSFLDVRYCIPSYTLEELLAVRQQFGIPEREVRERCLEFGPSARYVLLYDPESVKERVHVKMKNVTIEDMFRYRQSFSAVSEDKPRQISPDTSASLLKVVVDEEIYENPNDAYKLRNVQWFLASKNIMDTIMQNSKSESRRLVSAFVDVTGSAACLQAAAGKGFEGLVAPFIARGSFKYKCLRRESSRGKLTEMTFSRDRPLKIHISGDCGKDFSR